MTALDLTIDSIAAGGDGIGRHEGLVVFVPRSAPGDRVRVEATQHDRLMRARITQLLESGPARVEPPCAHYVVDRCGGCQLQHMEYDAQRHAKSGIIHDALARIGRVTVARPEVVPCDRQWRYRRKLTLAIRRQGSSWIAGLRRYDAPDEVFALHDCPITDERAVSDWRDVLAQSSHFPRAAALRGAVRLLADGFAFTMEGGRAWPEAEPFFAALPRLRELWWHPEGKRRLLLLSRSSESLAGASFVQVNPGVSELLRGWVLRLAAERPPGSVIDAYAGTGELAFALAAAGARVTAIEIDRDAARICASRLPEGSRAIAQPVERALASALPADLVIVNPPRGGLAPAVADTLRGHSSAPQRVIYISCNPATLARDVRRMQRFEVRSLRGFDMFPQTAHVETVCELAAAA